MKKLLILTAFAVGAIGTQSFAQPGSNKSTDSVKTKSAADTSKAKKLSIADKIKSSKKIDRLFTIYQDTATGSVQLYVKKDQLGKEFIYQSFSLNGPTALFLNQSMHRNTEIFKIVKAYDKLEFQEVNTRFYYDSTNAVSKTAGTDISEAVLLSEKYVAEDENGYLVSADALFLSEKLDPVRPLLPPGLPPGAVFNLGALNPTKSKYYNVRSFPKNTDIQVDLAYDNPAPFNQGGPDITDARYVRIRMQHSLMAMPQNEFRPRRDDPRIGYFTQEITDQTSIDPVPFRDVINRWYLRKKDPSAAVSEPVEPIVYYIENTTPQEYRDIIKEAGEKWNEAFEKAGFKNAVVMKMMPDNADWDPSDIKYNVIRWVSSAVPQYGAIGPSHVNPRTGQILGADISVEWFSGSASPIYDDLYNDNTSASFSVAGEHDFQNCSIGKELKAQYLAGLTAIEADGATPIELRTIHKQFLYYLVMHEMGHTFGLNHNMKASQMLKPSELNNTDITHAKGLMGSVMDYPAINVSLDRKKQGDYYTTKPGPYDMWAIEFGYTPTNSEAEEQAFRKRILSRSTEPDLAFGNDADDMRSPGKAIDPRVNVNDMSSDALTFADERFRLLNNIVVKLKDKYSKPDKSYAELKARYNVLNNQRLQMVSAVSRYIGGVYVDRSFVGQNSTTKPYTPVPMATQKKAMELLNKYILSPNAFDADAYLIPYLQSQRRGFNLNGGTNTEDPKLATTYVNMAFGAMAHILHPTTMQRLVNSRMYGNQYSATDVLSDLVKNVFDADLKTNVNIYRQYLQTAFVKNLIQLVETPTVDDISKASALYTLRKLKAKLVAAVGINEEVKAHRSNMIFLIDKSLEKK